MGRYRSSLKRGLTRRNLKSPEGAKTLGYIYLMIKAVRRLLAVFAVFAVLLGVLKSVINWVSRSGDDDHEIFADEEADVI